MKTEITLKELRKSVNNNLGGLCTVPRDIEFRIRQARKHKEFNPNLIHTIKTQNPQLVLSEATPEARRLYNMARQVGMDCHRIKMYARFSISKKGILYAKIYPEHRTESDALDFFFDRFPMYTIILESRRGTFFGSKKTGKNYSKDSSKIIIALLEKKMKDDSILSELDDSMNDSELWKEFYSAQYAGSRRNLRLFYKNMPKKNQNGYNMKMESTIFSGNRTLSEFG
ncbi:MAG: DUF4130 domain-containing protein [Candidatus Woesearchaeota archaeon]